MAIRNYLGVAEPTKDGWSLSFPHFPGTVTIAENFIELLANGRDALASVIDAMQEDGLAIPSGSHGKDEPEGFDPADYDDARFVLVSVEAGGKALRINVTMDEGLVARLDSFADRAHSSRSALLAKGARMVLAAEQAD